jgi:predicted permease
MPLFVMILLGYFLKRVNFMNDNFITIGNKFMFYILLPTTLFRSIYAVDLRELGSWQFAAFVVVMTSLSFFVLWIIGAVFIKNKQTLGAFVQGAFRSNTVFVGIPLMYNIDGVEGVARFAIVITLSMPLYNIFSVWILSTHSRSGEKIKPHIVLLNIMKNPLFIALALGFLLNLGGVIIPQILNRSLADITGMTTPMALICLGGSMKFLGYDKRFKYAIIASIIKIVALPAIFMLCAYLMGFRGIDIIALTVIGGLPSAIVGHVLVVQMGGDGYTAEKIVILTTLFSSVTPTIFIYALLALGLA